MGGGKATPIREGDLPDGRCAKAAGWVSILDRGFIIPVDEDADWALVRREGATRQQGGPRAPPRDLGAAKNPIVNELHFSYRLAPVRPFGRSGGYAAKRIIEKHLTQEEPDEVK